MTVPRSGWRRPIGRRAVLAGAGGSLATAWLAACSGDSKDETRQDAGQRSGQAAGQATTVATPRPGLLADLKDTSSQAKPGGTYQAYFEADIEGLDPHKAGSTQVMTVARFTSLRLLKKKTAFDGKPSTEVEGDLAQSYEVSSDGLQLTMKLRPGVIWDKRAPTNGRPVDAQDVKFSIDRFLATSTYGTNFFYSKSKAAPISSVEIPDAQTVVFKLAFPYMPLLATLSRTLNIWMLPREADSGYDPKLESRGCGPWILDSYKPSAGLEFKRNPDYYVKGRPFLDGWSSPIVPEYATRIAQFRAANIWGGIFKQEDLLSLKKDLPQLLMYQGDYGIDTPSLFFGFQGPFKDVRLRQAVSYLIDRPLIAETISDSSTFEKAGLPKSLRLNSFIGAGWPEWLDPASKDYGPNSRFFEQNVGEAKKLLTAAGINGKLQTKFYYPSNGYGAIYQQTVQIVAQMINDTGVMDARLTPVDYQKEYIPKIHFGGDKIGGWDGLALTPSAQGDEAGHQLQVQYHSGGAATRQPAGEDPKLDAMIDAQLRETDTKKRFTMTRDILKYMPETMITVPVFYQAAEYGLSWPWVGNAGVARTSVASGAPMAEVYPYLWFDKATYDKTKP